jgi:hypothetical protein
MAALCIPIAKPASTSGGIWPSPAGSGYTTGQLPHIATNSAVSLVRHAIAARSRCESRPAEDGRRAATPRAASTPRAYAANAITARDGRSGPVRHGET